MARNCLSILEGEKRLPSRQWRSARASEQSSEGRLGWGPLHRWTSLEGWGHVLVGDLTPANTEGGR